MSLEVLVLGGLAVGIVSGLIGIWVANQKRRSPIEGWWAGFVLGPLGVLLVALFPAGEPPKKKPPARSLSRSGWQPPPDETLELEDDAAKWLRNSDRN